MKLLVLIIVLFSFQSFGDARKDKTHPCYFDIPLHCKPEVDLEVTEYNCLLQKVSILSPKCTTFAENLYLQHPCGKDILRWCHGSKKNIGKFTQCLVDHEKNLSIACKKELPDLKASEKASSKNK